MTDIKIYIVRQDRDDDVMPYDVASETSVGDLKSIVAAETDSEPNTFTLVHNNKPLVDDTKTLQAAGIGNGDLLSFAPRPPPSQNTAGQSSSNTAPAQSPDEAQAENLRQQLLAHPEQRQQVAQIPGLLENLQNPQAFRDSLFEAERKRRAQAEQHYRQMEQLNDNVTEENQAKILEMIRQERIDKEVEETMLTNPEFFGRVTMLYVAIEVNGVAVKAFVDSGAQATIMSPDCAERCGITHLIDRRWQSIARGVGTAKILGRIHRANVKIGHDEVPCSFTILEGKDVDMLFGLDMLKRYQACIDLSQNRLVFPGGQSVPFLPESEIPKNFDEPPDSDLANPGQPSNVTRGTGPASVSSASASGSTSASAAKPAQNNFQGQGHSLGPPSAPPSTSSGYTAPPGPPPGQTAATASSPSQSSSAEFPQKDIDALMGMGISRQQAVALLRACGGNVDMAAAAAFDMS